MSRSRARSGPLVILLLLIGSALPASLRAQAPATPPISANDEKIWRSASALFARGLYWEAETRFRDLAERLTDHAKVHFGLGAALARSDRPQAALVAFDRALELGLRDAQCLLLRAGVLETLGRPDEAARAFAAGAALAPDHAELRLRYGIFLHRRGERDAAGVELEAARRLRPKHAATLHAGASLAFREGKLKRARDLATQAVRHDPRRPAPRYLLSRIAAREKKKEEAREHAAVFRRLRREEETRIRAEQTSRARVGLAYRAWRARDLAAAVGYFESALEARRGDEQARAGLEALAKGLPAKSALRGRVAGILERDRRPPEKTSR